MNELGLGAYRFSIAWPRMNPTAAVPSTPAGSTSTTGSSTRCSPSGIEPWPTLYHWDLPEALEEAGGWLARDDGRGLCRLRGGVVERLGDRVDAWMTVNEP